MDINWRKLLEDALEKAGSGGKATVAERLGISRAYVSRVMNPDGKSGIQDPSPEFVNRVIQKLHTVLCPITNRETDRVECQKATGPAPTHNPLAVQVWRKCQTCPNKPERGAK